MSDGVKEEVGEGDGPKPSPQVGMASKRFQQTQAQVDEVVGIMRTNVERVLERDTKLSELVSFCLVDDRTYLLKMRVTLSHVES